jgi:hypothetical protein
MVVVLALYELLVIIASSRASDILYRVEPPVCNPSVNVTEFAILNVCTGSGECRAVCADEAWGKQIAQQICESWVKYHQVMAFNHTMPEKLSHRVGRVKLNCRANVAASCTATKVGSCATTRIAALNCKVGEDDYIEIESLKLKKLSKRKVNPGNVEDLTSKALKGVEAIESLSVDDVHYSVKIYENVQQSGISNNSKASSGSPFLCLAALN